MRSVPVVPRCFEAHWDLETNTWHLLLEDLTDSHAAPTQWPLPPTFDQSIRIVRALARLHPAWWDDPRLDLSVGTWLDGARTCARGRTRVTRPTSRVFWFDPLRNLVLKSRGSQ